MKVLRIITRLNVGGPSFQVRSLMNGLPEHGFQQRLIVGTPAAGEDEVTFANELDPIRLSALQRPLSLTNDYRAWRQLTRLIRDEAPTVVHTHMGKAGWLGRLAAKRAGVPFLAHTYHGHTFQGYWRGLRNCAQLWTERHVGRATTAIIAQSPSQGEEVVSALRGDTARRLHIIEPGVDFAALDAAADSDAERDPNIEAGGARVVTFLGRLASVKNCRGFLEVVARVQKETDDDVVAFVVGGGTRDAVQELKNYAQSIGLGSSCRWLGYRQDVGAIYRATDVLVSTSISEGTPLNLIEALSLGVSVVSTDVGGVRDTIGRYPEATLCAAGNVRQLADAVVSQLAAKTRPASTRDDVRKRFASSRLVAETAALYRAL